MWGLHGNDPESSTPRESTKDSGGEAGEQWHTTPGWTQRRGPWVDAAQRPLQTRDRRREGVARRAETPGHAWAVPARRGGATGGPHFEDVRAGHSLEYPRGCCAALSHVRPSVTPGTAARQAPLSMGFSRQEYCSGLPRPPPGNPPTQGSKPGLLHCRRILYQLSYQESPREG